MASIRQRQGRWQARIVRKGYPAETQTFETREAALQWARALEAKMDRGDTLLRSNAAQMQFHDLIDRYIEDVVPLHRGAKDEIIRLRALQRHRIAQYSMKNLTQQVLAQFRDERLRTVTAGTAIRDLAVISAMINHARREWLLPITNPCELLKKPASPRGRNRVLDDKEEAALLLELAPRGRRNPLMFPIVVLAIETAMRRGELLALKWHDVDLKRRVVQLHVTKNGDPRTVPLSPRALSVLENHPGDRCGSVFPITHHAMAAAFKLACRRAGIADFHFHDLRHTATSRIAGKLSNLVELSAVTGHRSLSMLHRYYHVKAEELARKLAV
ncbi:MAG: site-specific integrase [Formivibrio sp.]|nr:site-specific integrase [Formivibrio sp.]